MTDSTTFGDAPPPEAADGAKKPADKSPKKTGQESAPEQMSPAKIQSDIDAAQKRLADQVDQLSDRLQPQALAEDAIGGIKRVFLEPDGSPKTKPIALVAGGLASLIVLRKIFHRG